MKNCALIGNSAAWGDGSDQRLPERTLVNCLIAGNTASNEGGGVSGGLLYNCTVAGNTAVSNGGGTIGAYHFNSIIYSNRSILFPVTDDNWAEAQSFTVSCTYPDPEPYGFGPGTITNDPQFMDVVAGDYRLKPASLCNDAGINESWMFDAADLGGNTRIINGSVDMGAFELVFEANLKAFLRAPYDTNTHLMAKMPNLPTNSPYAADPRTAAAIPSNATDWVHLQVRRDTNSAPELSRSAWISDTGDFLSDTGAPPVLLEVGTGTYYIVVYHRNHLATMTANPIPLTNRQFSYDFTTSASQNYSGTNSVTEVESNVWALVAGDADGDGEVQTTDELIWQTQGGIP